MKKEKICKILYWVSALLIVGFGIRLGADYYQYTTTLNSAPFSLTIWIRAIEFGVPAAVCLAAACILKKKAQKEGEDCQ